MYLKKNIKVLIAILCSFMVSISISAMEENSKEEVANQTGEKFDAVRKKFQMDEIEYELGEMKKENWDDMSKTKDINNLNNSAIFTAKNIKKDFNRERVNVNHRPLNRFIDNMELNQNYEKTNIKDIINEKNYYSRYRLIMNRLYVNSRYLNDLKMNGVDEKTKNKIDILLEKIDSTKNSIIEKEINASAKKDLESIEKDIKNLEKHYEKNNVDEKYVCRDRDFLIVLEGNREYLECLKGKANQQTKEKIDRILEKIEDTEKLIFSMKNVLKSNREYLKFLKKEDGVNQQTKEKINRILNKIKDNKKLISSKKDGGKNRLKLLENLRWIKENVENLEKKEEKSEGDSLYKSYFYGFNEILNEIKANREHLEELSGKEVDGKTRSKIEKILKKIEETENLSKNKNNYTKIKDRLKDIKKDIKNLEKKEEKEFNFKNSEYSVKSLFYEEEDLKKMERDKFEELKKNIESLFENTKTLKKILDEEQVNNIIKNSSIIVSNKNLNLMLKTLEEIMPKIKLEYYEDEDLFTIYKTIEKIGEYQIGLADLRKIEKDKKIKTRITNLIHNFYFMTLDFIKMLTYKISEKSFGKYRAYEMIFYLGELTGNKVFLSDFNKVKDNLLKDKNFKTIFKKIIKQNEEELNEIIEKIKEQMVRVFNIYINLIDGVDMNKCTAEFHVSYLKYVQDELYVLLNEEEKLVFNSIMKKFNDILEKHSN